MHDVAVCEQVSLRKLNHSAVKIKQKKCSKNFDIVNIFAQNIAR